MSETESKEETTNSISNIPPPPPPPPPPNFTITDNQPVMIGGMVNITPDSMPKLRKVNTTEKSKPVENENTCKNNNLKSFKDKLNGLLSQQVHMINENEMKERQKEKEYKQKKELEKQQLSLQKEQTQDEKKQAQENLKASNEQPSAEIQIDPNGALPPSPPPPPPPPPPESFAAQPHIPSNAVQCMVVDLSPENMPKLRKIELKERSKDDSDVHLLSPKDFKNKLNDILSRRVSMLNEKELQEAQKKKPVAPPTPCKKTAFKRLEEQIFSEFDDSGEITPNQDTNENAEKVNDEINQQINEAKKRIDESISESNKVMKEMNESMEKLIQNPEAADQMIAKMADDLKQSQLEFEKQIEEMNKDFQKQVNENNQVESIAITQSIIAEEPQTENYAEQALAEMAREMDQSQQEFERQIEEANQKLAQGIESQSKLAVIVEEPQDMEQDISNDHPILEENIENQPDEMNDDTLPEVVDDEYDEESNDFDCEKDDVTLTIEQCNEDIEALLHDADLFFAESERKFKESLANNE